MYAGPNIAVGEVHPDKNADTNNQKTISTFSLASIDFKNSISNDKEIEEVNLPNKEFSKYDLLKSWKSFCNMQEEKGNINISSVLKMNEPSVKGENIIIKTVNQINKKEIENIGGDILSYLKKELENHSINLKVIIEKNIKTNRK